MKISELTEEQKRHLTWRLNHKTAMGLPTAYRYVRGEGGDLEVVELFRRGGRTDRSAKIHATKVRNYG